MESGFALPCLSVSSVTQSCHLLVTYGLQHARLPCPSPSPGACSNSSPSSPWCHPTISSPVVPFSSCLQSFPASGSFPMSQFFSPGGQSIGVSASASVLPMNTQDWFPLGWTGWISLQSKGLSRVQHHSSKASILQRSAFFMIQLSHPHTTRTMALTRQTFVGKVMSLLFNMLSRFVITFLPRSKRILISWLHHHLQWFWSPQNKVSHCFHHFPTYLPWSVICNQLCHQHHHPCHPAQTLWWFCHL